MERSVRNPNSISVGVAADWGFTTIPDWFNESWVFVLDAKGNIHQRFEGFTTVEEMEEALQSALALH